MTAQVVALLGVMLDDPTQARYGLELARAAKLYTGTLYPLLSRLERAGWLESWWEDVDPSAAGRPRRRLYRLTPTGRVAGREGVQKREKSLGVGFGLGPRPAGGHA